MGRQHRVCDYFFIRDSQRQGGGDVCGQQSAKKGRKENCGHVNGRRNCQKGVRGGPRAQQEGPGGGQRRATGSLEQSDPARQVRVREPALTSPTRWEKVLLFSHCFGQVSWGPPPPPPHWGRGGREKVAGAACGDRPSCLSPGASFPRRPAEAPPGRTLSPHDPFSPPLRPQEGDTKPGREDLSLLSTPANVSPRHPAATKAGIWP